MRRATPGPLNEPEPYERVGRHADLQQAFRSASVVSRDTLPSADAGCFVPIVARLVRDAALQSLGIAADEASAARDPALCHALCDRYQAALLAGVGRFGTAGITALSHGHGLAL